MQEQGIDLRTEEGIYNRFVQEIRDRGDVLIERLLVGYFVFGLFLSMFYDTWFLGLSVGGLLLVLYFLAKKMFPNTSLNQYVASGVFGVFMGQYIYQMHGLFEMHFFAFISATILITYQNWKIQIPLAIVIVLHHAVFGYLQYLSFSTGSESSVYFTQLDYMDMQTFMFHCGLAVLILLICAKWAMDLQKRTLNTSRNMVEIERMSDVMTRNLEFASMLASGEEVEKLELHAQDDYMGMTLNQIHTRLSEK
ncbi:hypothetical protein BFP72_11430 [Reichenbachiella sp. 5M10]|nr:hypothetical protein BFP72_11430 [Reichenbachiella sp. 5M10]